MTEYKPRILNKYSQQTKSNTSISTFGSQSGSRKQSLTPIDISSAFINLRRRSLGYDNLNDPPKEEEEIQRVKSHHHPRNISKVDSSSEFLPTFKVTSFIRFCYLINLNQILYFFSIKTWFTCRVGEYARIELFTD